MALWDQMKKADAKASAEKKAARAERTATPSGKRDEPREGGDGGTARAKASGPPPAGVQVEDDASDVGEKVNTVDRITFSAPVSEGWPARIEGYRKREGLRSMSEAIRDLLVRGLK